MRTIAAVTLLCSLAAVSRASDSTCILPPVAPGQTPDEDLIAQCHLQQTQDATLALAPSSAADRLICEVNPGLIFCNITWRNAQGACRIVSCSYSNSDGLICSPQGSAVDSMCD